MNLSLTDEIVLLRAQVDYLLEQVAENPGITNSPVNWAALDTLAAAEQWGLLIEWTDFLRSRYLLHDAIPACWYDHPPLVEELSALRCAWVGAFRDPNARAGDAVTWHDMLDRVIARIKRWDRAGCTDGQHRTEPSAVDGTDPSHRERTVHADLARRDTDTATTDSAKETRA
jgi:hypothetical protein